MSSASELTPAQRGYVMPAEWEDHEATWMCFPPQVYPGELSLDVVRDAWVEVAIALAQFEEVRLLVRGDDEADARSRLGGAVTYVPCELDDAWARDIAPSFVRDEAGTLLAIDWQFNGWGAQDWASWDHDDKVAARVAEHLGVERFRAGIVNEGGGIEVDGAGRLLVTDTVQLDPQRNPDLSRGEVEDALRDALGVNDVTWLARGLEGDNQEFGTRGHVDLVAKFVAPGVAVVHDQRDSTHPDHEVSAMARERLLAAGVEVVDLAAPRTRMVGDRLCDWSYVNCTFANGGVVLGTYGDESDDAAVSTLRTLLPDRRVVTVDARPLFALGGGVHCITQQQPVSRRP